MLGLIWIQTVWHSDGKPKELSENINFEEKQSEKDKKSI